MEINLLTISKQCWSIINICSIILPTEFPERSDLLNNLYDIYPALDITSYKLYWRFNDEAFYEIVDYLSYLTVVRLMMDKNLYLLIDDCDEHCHENEELLRRLDHEELKEKLERERDIYDVCILRPGEVIKDSFESIQNQISIELKTDSEIILYAIRNFERVKYYTADLIFKTNVIQGLIRGWPKEKVLLVPLKDEVISRAPKSKKGSSKKSKKGKDKGKGKGKGKGKEKKKGKGKKK